MGMPMRLTCKAEGIDDVFAGGDDGGDQCGKQADERGHGEDGDGGLPFHSLQDEAAGFGHALGQQKADAHAHDAADDADENRFAHDQLQDFAGVVAQRAEDGHFAGAFAHGHGDGVGRDQEDRECDRRADRGDEKADVAQQGEEGAAEFFFGFGAGGLGGIVEHGVDGLADAGDQVGGLGEDDEGAGGVFHGGVGGLEKFGEVFLVEDEVFLIKRCFVDSDDV